MKELMVYLKTTETCQLNCKHCFTSGSMGKRVFFNPDKVISFFQRLKQVVPVLPNGGHVAFHGGEPMLAPIADMRRVHQSCKDLWKNVMWSVQSNLVYNLDDEKLAFFDEVTGRRQFGTSWDPNIRFPSAKAESLWEQNVRTLSDLGYPVTVMICLTAHTMQREPKELIQKMIDLGVKYVAFERVTNNGSARTNDQLYPGNKNLDAYLLRMWEQTVQYGFQRYIHNILLGGVVTSFLNSSHTGERCRNCEQKIFTLNADGTVGGCPNSATEKPYAHIDWGIMDIMYSKGRMKEIACESVRNPNCYTCVVKDICNGDCHQLAWEGDVCAAPKSLMTQIKSNLNSTDPAISLKQYNELIDFQEGRLTSSTATEVSRSPSL